MRKTRVFRSLCAAAAALILIMSLAACASPAKKIVGEWKAESSALGISYETVYKFNSDGSGSKSTVAGLNVAFTYEITDSSLIIKNDVLGIETSSVYSYAFDGDTLRLTENSVVIELVRVK